MREWLNEKEMQRHREGEIASEKKKKRAVKSEEGKKVCEGETY